MKTRNGFVSNSSSSSFVIVGYKEGDIFTNRKDILERYAPSLLQSAKFLEDLKNHGEEAAINEIWQDFLYETDDRFGFCGIEGIQYLADHDPYKDKPGYIGFVLGDTRYDFEDKECSLDDIIDTLDRFKTHFGIALHPKIIIGSRGD